MLYQLLKTTHSLTAYLVLGFLLFSVVNALLGLLQKRAYTKKDLRIHLFALIFTHLQVTLGLILYVVTPLLQSWGALGAKVMKDAYLRKMLVEHPFGLVAAILITVGWSLHKKQKTDQGAFKKILIFYAIGLLLILGVLPWKTWLAF
jgi:hypothetical protein